AAAEDAVEPLVEPPPVSHDIAAIVRLIRHHDDQRVTARVIEPAHDCPTKPVLTDVLHRHDLRELLVQFLKQFPGAIGAAVIDDHDLVRHTVQVKLQVQVLRRRDDAPFLVARGYDHGEEAQCRRTTGVHTNARARWRWSNAGGYWLSHPSHPPFRRCLI